MVQRPGVPRILDIIFGFGTAHKSTAMITLIHLAKPSYHVYRYD